MCAYNSSTSNCAAYIPITNWDTNIKFVGQYFVFISSLVWTLVTLGLLIGGALLKIIPRVFVSIVFVCDSLSNCI